MEYKYMQVIYFYFKLGNLWLSSAFILFYAESSLSSSYPQFIHSYDHLLLAPTSQTCRLLLPL